MVHCATLVNPTNCFHRKVFSQSKHSHYSAPALVLCALSLAKMSLDTRASITKGAFTTQEMIECTCAKLSLR